MPLAGDTFIQKPIWQTTRAITLHRPTDAIWPWLVQLGYGKAGYYAWFPVMGDKQFGAGALSVEKLMPEFQTLKIGDHILDGPDCDEKKGVWKVVSLETGNNIVYFSRRKLTGEEIDPKIPLPENVMDCVWSFHLVARKPGVTRLLVRTITAFHPKWKFRLVKFLAWGDTVMQNTMLMGIKYRVERMNEQTERV